MAAGYGVAGWQGCRRRRPSPSCTRSACRTSRWRLLITLTILRSPDLAVTALLYAVVMPAVALAFLPVARKIIANEEAGTLPRAARAH